MFISRDLREQLHVHRRPARPAPIVTPSVTGVSGNAVKATSPAGRHHHPLLLLQLHSRVRPPPPHLCGPAGLVHEGGCLYSHRHPKANFANWFSFYRSRILMMKTASWTRVCGPERQVSGRLHDHLGERAPPQPSSWTSRSSTPPRRPAGSPSCMARPEPRPRPARCTFKRPAAITRASLRMPAATWTPSSTRARRTSRS